MKQVWIGLACVKATREGLLASGVQGAYVNALVRAETQEQFRDRLVLELTREGFEVIDIEDVEPMANRLGVFEMDEDIREMAAECENSDDVFLGAFHMW